MEAEAKDCQGLTVHAMNFVHGRGPVFYASMPIANETLKGCGTNGAGDKRRLISALWDHFVAMESPLGNAVNPPVELLRSQFRWSVASLAGPIFCWENIGVRPSPSAMVEERSGLLSAEMSLASALMWQGPRNSNENIPFTGSSTHKSLNMP